MASHHLPDPLFFWATAAVLIAVALWLFVFRREPVARLFAGLLVLLAVPIVDFALVIHNWPQNGLVPGPEGAVEMPSGLGLPWFFWSLQRAAVPVAAVLLVLYLPDHQRSFPTARHAWAFGVPALVGLAAWEHLSAADTAWGLAWTFTNGLVFPAVSAVLFVRAFRVGPGPRAVAPLLMSLAFLVLSLPELVWRGLRDYRMVVDMDPSASFWGMVLVGAVLGGVVAFGAAGLFLASLAAAFRPEAVSKPFLAYSAVTAGLLVLALVADERAWSLYGDLLPYAIPVLFALLGVAGLRSAAPRGGPERSGEAPGSHTRRAVTPLDAPVEDEEPAPPLEP